MSYEKLGFTSGQKLKAEHLNHMEEGIANAGCASEPKLLGEIVLTNNNCTVDEGNSMQFNDELSNAAYQLLEAAKTTNMIKAYVTVANEQVWFTPIVCQNDAGTFLCGDVPAGLTDTKRVFFTNTFLNSNVVDFCMAVSAGLPLTIKVYAV